MNILLLGGTGYLGGNIVNKLSYAGHNVTCVVRNSSDISRLKNINLISNDLTEIEIFLKSNRLDWIINGVCTYKSNDTLYGDLLESNIIFPLSVLNLAVKYNVVNFITMGTSLPENLNIYSFSKHKYAEFGRFLCDIEHINFADLRLEMFYGGEFEPNNRFISSCAEKLSKNEPLKLTSGLQKRDIIRVEDIIEIVSKLINSDYIRGYKELDVGSGENHSIKEIIEYMKKRIKSKSTLNFGAVKSRLGEPNTIAKIDWYNDIGFRLKYSFFDGLDKECEDFMKNN